MSKIANSVLQLVSPIATEMGLEVVEVEYAKKHDGMHLTIFIDKKDGVTINDCEKLHRAIDAPLDKLGPIDGAYTLNVSSLGLDRPLKTQRDFERNLNKKICVKLYQAIDKKKEFTGVLIEYDEEKFVILDKNQKQICFEISKTAHIEPHIEF